jgi:glycerol-3-phosphate acyltransferase PlsY
MVAGVTAAMFLLILWRHRANLVRMFAGTEPRVGAKKAG